MNMRQQQTANFYSPTFTVIRGFLGQTTEIDTLTNTAWSFAHTALWNHCIFSETEVANAKLSIKSLLVSAKNPTRCYNIFCQRVLLARQYVLASPTRFIPLPSVWLDNQNALGFAGTKAWYLNIKKQRASLPNYKIELKALGVAVLEMSEAPTVKNFQYWKNYFIEKNATGLLNLFLNTVANQQFSI